MWLLRNPTRGAAASSGCSATKFDWTHAGFEFGGVAFTNVAVRVKGNVGSLQRPKRPFKVDLKTDLPKARSSAAR